MRLLLLGATDIRNSDATLLLAAAFERSGCVVQVVPVTTELPALAAIGFAGGHGEDRVYQVAMSRHVLALTATLQPDVVMVYGSNFCLLPGAIRRLKRRYGCKVVLWEVNQHIFHGVGSTTLSQYDRVFLLDSYFVEALRVAGAKAVEHLGACADPEEHRPVPTSEDDLRRYGADVSFIGTRSDERIKMLRVLAHTDLRIYGTGWGQARPPLDRCVRDEPVYGLKKNKIYGLSRMSLNVHQPHMVHGENFRVFEVAACGGASVSAWKPDLAQALEPGREVIVFDGPDDLRKKVDHYLRRPDDLDEIAHAGRARVLAEHTYEHRARTIIDSLT